MTGTIIAGLRALHYGVLAYGLIGWAIPIAEALIFYLIFLPLLVVQWWFNRDSCILDNVETWLTTGIWRAPQHNPGEGNFVRNLIERVFRVRLSDAANNGLVYGLMALFFAFAAAHLAFLTP